MIWDDTHLQPPLRSILDRAATAGKTIALSEGSDPRIVQAACIAASRGIAKIILVGSETDIRSELTHQGLEVPKGVSIQDPQTSDLTASFADSYFELRGHKGVSRDTALTMAQDPLVFSAMLVRHDHAVGTVGGAVATTSDTVRAALHVIGKAPDAALVSSFFLMFLPDGHSLDTPAMVFSDCGMVIDPNASELASIASQAANSFSSLLNATARVGMLSFSTQGSARHPMVTKVADATQALIQARPDLIVSGELQLDAAVVPSVAHTKAPDSAVSGRANVLIFPNLDAGNIGYKLAQRFGGATAVGPVLQGLNKPANDLSRGCNVEDVIAMIAVTAVQAQ